MRPAPKSKNRAHTGSIEIRAIWSYIDLTWLSNSVTWSAPNAFIDAATYSSGTPTTMSTLASPRTRSAFADVEATMAFFTRLGCRRDPVPEHVMRSFSYLSEDVCGTMQGPEWNVTGNLRDWDATALLGELDRRCAASRRALGG